MAKAAVPAVSALLSRRVFAAVNSMINSVQIGTITYSFKQDVSRPGDIIPDLLKIGLSEVELMSDDGQRLAGAPSITSFGFGARLNPQQQATVEEGRRRRRDWRTKTTEGAFDKIRQLFDHARISLRILCCNMSANIADGKIAHAFRMAQALQVAAISSTRKVTIARRVAPFAEKYKIIWAGHNHGSTQFRRDRIP